MVALVKGTFTWVHSVIVVHGPLAGRQVIVDPINPWAWWARIASSALLGPNLLRRSCPPSAYALRLAPFAQEASSLAAIPCLSPSLLHSLQHGEDSPWLTLTSRAWILIGRMFSAGLVEGPHAISPTEPKHKNLQKRMLIITQSYI